MDFNLTGWTHRGRLFRSHLLEGRPTRMPVRALIPGLAEALGDMAVGERRRLWIPAGLGFGPVKDQLQRDNQPAGPLVAEVELIRIAR